MPSGRRALHRWHRRAGVAAAAVLIFLLATGVPLQFSGWLELGRHYVSSPLLLDWYGLEAPGEVWMAGGMVTVGDELFLASGEHVTGLPGFQGAVVLAELGITAAAGAREVLLVTSGNAELVDRFPMPAPVQRIGLYADRPVVETTHGLLMADPDLVRWQPASVAPAAVSWAELQATDDPAPYRQRFRERLLTLERVLQDAHSGRLLGTPGLVIVDVASLLLVFLAISGLIMWWRTFNR